jgi:hypothetical protein
MDRFSFLIEMPYRLFLLGVFFLIVAMIETTTGKAVTRGQGLVSRAEDPKTFWFMVVVAYLVGVCFIVEFLWRIGEI